MFLHVCALNVYEIFQTHFATAEVEGRQEHINTDRLHDILKDQGTSLCMI